jgi:autotransporter-associated beta strand protein
MSQKLQVTSVANKRERISTNGSRRRRAVALAALSFASLSALGSSVALADATWTGSAGQNFNDATNWSATPTGNLTINTSTGAFPTIGVAPTVIPTDLLIGAGAGNSGRLDQSSGTLSLANTSTTGNWMFVGSGGGTGEYNLTGSGSLLVGKLWIGGYVYGENGTGTVTVNTTGTITANSAQDVTNWGQTQAAIIVGWGQFPTGNSTATLNLQQGTINANGQGMFVGAWGSNSTLNQTGGTINTAGLSIGRWFGTGVANVTNGTINSSGSIWLARGGAANDSVFGTLNVNNAGVVNSENDFIVAFAGDGATAGSTGKLNIATGGTVNIGSTTKRWMIVNQWDTVKGEVNVDGGTLNLNTNTDLRFSTGNGTGTSVVNLNSGAINAWSGNKTGANSAGVVDLNRAGGTAANNTFNLNGGTLTIAQVVTTSDNGTAAFNFNGGTLRATTNTANFVDLGGATQTANVKNGGAVIDSNGFNVTVPQALVASGTGGLTKNGAGALTLSGVNTYTGATTVSAGSLVVGGAGSINATSGITVNGAGAKFVSTSSVAVTPAVTVTSGGVDGTGTIGTVNVASGASNFVANGNGSTAALTVNSLSFQGAGKFSLNVGGATPEVITTTLTTNGVGSVSIDASNTLWTEGTYNLISYSTLGGTGFSAFTKGTIAGLSNRQSATLSNPAGFISLVIAGDNPRWSGAVSNEWSTATLANPKNWALITSGNGTDYIQGDIVLFDDNAASTSPTISTANVSPTSVLFNNTTKNYTLSGSFGIAGTTGVTKQGTGSLTISNANTYSGGTTIAAGALNINNANAIGTGPLSVGAGVALDNTSGAAVTLATNNAQTWNGDVTFGGSNALNLGTGAVTRTGATTVTVNGSAPVTVGGAVGGTGALTKAGAGTLVLGGANTYTGATAVTSGALNVIGSVANSAVTNVSGGGALNVTGSFSNTGTIVTTGSVSVAGTMTSTGDFAVARGNNGVASLNVQPGGVLNADVVLVGTGDSPTAVANGTATIAAGATVNTTRWFVAGHSGAAGTTGTVNINGGTLNVRTSGNQGTLEVATWDPMDAVLNIEAGSTVRLQNNASIVMGAQVHTGTSTVNQNGGAVTFYSDGGTTVGGTGRLVMGGTAGWGSSSGTYTYNLNGGTLTVPSIGTDSAVNPTKVFNFNGGTLRAAGNTNVFMGNLSRANVRNGGAIVDTNGANIAVNQPFAHSNVSGDNAIDGGLTKAGAGTLLMKGVATYTGNTVITGGTLQLPSGATPVAVGKYSFDDPSLSGTLFGGAVVPNIGSGGAAMNGTVNDSAHLLGGGGASIVAGRFGNALAFDGAGSAVDIASKIVDQNGAGTWTMSAWVQTSTPGSSILSKNDANIAWNDGDSIFYIGSSATPTNNLPSAVRYAGGFMTGDPAPVNTADGAWHMVTYVSNEGVKTIFVDGVAVAMTATAFNNADPSTLVKLGYSVNTVPTDGTLNYTGAMDELNFFSSALTPTQIQSLYASNVVSSGSQQYLPSTTAVSITATGGSLDINGNDQTIGSLSGVAGTSVLLGSGTLTTGSTNASTTFAGAISGSGGIVKQGTGTMTLSGANTYTGRTIVKGGAVVFGVAGGAHQTVLGGASVTSPGGVALEGGRVSFDYATTTTVEPAVGAAIRASATSGFTTGKFTSSLVGATKGIGWLDDLANKKVLVAVTLFGDATLDFTVNFDDLLKLAANYNQTGRNWSQGDFTYDGVVNFDDLLKLASNYNQTTTGSFGGDWALAQASVPEPTALAVGAIGAAGLLSRRRRRS